MLQAIRERAQGWFAWAIVILISVPFALWGIQEYIKVGSQAPAATVDGHDISDRELSQQVQQARISLRTRMGRNYRPEMVDQTQLRKDVLDNLIRDRLTVDTSVDIGLRVGDEQVKAAILAIPAFQKDGQFDNDAYERVLAMQGTAPAQFEERVRTSLMTTQLNRVVSSSEFTTEQDLAESIKLRHQQRSFKYFLLPIVGFVTNTEIPNKELDAYYQAHRNIFGIPEQVKLDYLMLGQADGAPIEGVSEVSLRAAYQANIKQYQTPEQRQIRHILIALDPKAKPEVEQAAEKRIAEIRSRIVGGADFAKVAKETSQDPGSASQGGDLGLVGRGVMDHEFEKAAFALPTGTLSVPVRSAFGWHLIEVTKIEPERTKPFAEVRGELTASAQADALSKRYLSMAERLGNLAYEHSDSLEPAAQALGLKVQHSDWLSKSKGGGTGVLADPKAMAAAFSDEVLTQGNNSDLIEITAGHGQQALVMRVTDHRSATIKPLTEVKSQIVATLRQEQAKQAALKQAETLATQLRNGEALTKVAANYKIVEQALTRRDAAKTIPSEVLDSAFKLPKTQPNTPSIGVVETGSAAVVVMLGEIKDGKLAELDAAQRKSESRDLAQAQAKAYYDDMLDDLKQRAKVWIAPQNEHPVTAEAE